MWEIVRVKACDVSVCLFLLVAGESIDVWNVICVVMPFHRQTSPTQLSALYVANRLPNNKDSLDELCMCGTSNDCFHLSSNVTYILNSPSLHSHRNPTFCPPTPPAPFICPFPPCMVAHLSLCGISACPLVPFPLSSIHLSIILCHSSLSYSVDNIGALAGGGVVLPY